MKTKSKKPRSKKNLRNYYRVLFVQPDAPMEIIQASYRTIMQKLKAHPDLGGDTWNAAVINEAYQTLIDPARRVAYDKTIAAKKNVKNLGMQSDAQRYKDTQNASDGVGFSGTWQEFRPRTV